MEDSKEGDDREMMLRSGDGAGAENGRAAGELGALTPQDSTEESNGMAMPQNRVDGGVKEVAATGELKTLKLQRGRKAALLTRACNTAEIQIDRCASEEELRKRLESLNTALEGFLEINGDYVEKVQEVGELEEAEEYAARLTARHASAIKAIKEAIKLKSSGCSASETEGKPMSLAPRRDGSKVSGSRASKCSKASTVAREAEITAEMKALELKHLRARKERERQKEEQEDMLKEQEDTLRKARERQSRKQEDMLEEKAMQEEVERALVKARLCKAAESDLEWERRHDFDGENVALVPRECNVADGPVTVDLPQRRLPPQEERRTLQPEQQTAANNAELPSSKNEQHPANWVTAVRSEQQPLFHQQSAFVKSIPRLTLPTFRGSAQEWPRWIGLFKALVHNQPSLSDSERMAHLQNAVEGPAAQAINGMLFNGELYQEALKTLQERFGREEDIIQAHLRKIFTSTPPSLMDLPAMEQFYSVVHNTVTVLRNLGYSSDLASSENLRRVVEKLPVELGREWGREVHRLRPVRPTLEAFSSWLKTEVDVLSHSASRSVTNDRKGSAKSRDGGTARKSAFATGATPSADPESRRACVMCEGMHKLPNCPTFKAKTTEAKLDIVSAEGLCFSCLGKGHWSRKCRMARRCGIEGCKFKHHPLLHDNKGQAVADKPHKEEGSSSAPFVAASLNEETDTLLQVVRVQVHGIRGSKEVLALLDTGAQTSLCSEDVLRDLGIAGHRRQLRIQNVEGSGAQKSSQRVSLTISALDPDGKKNDIKIPEVWSVPALNVTAPVVARSQLKGCEHLRGLEFPQYDGGQVELLIGANVLEAVLQRETRVGRPNQPVAVKTDLGWALTGSVSAIVPSSLRQVMSTKLLLTEPEDELSAAVSEWWSTESFGTRYRATAPRSREDERAFKMLEENTTKDEGRYKTGLLWRESDASFPNNKVLAMKRLQATERKLEKQPDIAVKYRATIEAYIAAGHARKLTVEEASAPTKRRWLLPHHAVTNPNKPGKVRVVFDAAAAYRGTSLNGKLLTGPDLLQSLPGVLLRFREGPVAVAADITQMYHQIMINEDDQPALSFLWRDMDSNRPPDMYQMQVLIFGARSSPAIANYVLRRALQDHWNEEGTAPPREPEQIQRSFYMDDFLLSDVDVNTAKHVKQEATRALAEGGFKLTKWRSNRREVLEGTSTNELANPDGNLCLGAPTATAEKALGVVWNENQDTLGFRLRESDEPLTKRGVLSRTASVFDPLGIASPFTVKARLMMQRLWSHHLAWDDTLPEPEMEEWRDWLRDSECLQNISIPRCIRPEEDVKCQQLHVFCDASEAAFGAVIFMRSTTTSGMHQCRFLIAKNRVAPLKKLSIVRLELQAALLGARLASTVVEELSRKPDAMFFWSDSSVVLQYLSNESRRFHTFVANRVAEVKELTAGGTWRHVPGKMNPADDCSRGLAASELTSQSRWLSGPAFLSDDEENWPAQTPPAPLMDDMEEVRPSVLASVVHDDDQLEPDPSKFSSWLKYRRVVAWMKRFAHNAAARASNGETRRTGPLKSEELDEAEVLILRRAQRAAYPEETRSLALGNELPKRSGLLPLSPYSSDDGLMRVGGRLENAPIPEDARHPVILPPRGEVTRLVILQRHESCGHAGVEQTLNETRQKYWVVRGRAAVKQLLQGCPTCRRLRALPRPPRMASLPAARFDATRPFSSTGVDMFGPLFVKRFRRTEKRYGLIATCMATRAIHLEVVYSLDTDSCIMALRRLFARRGKPAAIFSDNGTNFVGSQRELRAELRAMEKKLAEKLSAFEVDWHFNPPAASHMGGVWERMVRSVKNSLRIVVGRQTLTDEVLMTVLAEVEHMVNSRPLTYVSSEPTDPEALTPNHFLLSGAHRHLAPGLVGERDVCSRRRWKQSQAVAEHVWRRWTKEYVPTLTQRSKWYQERRNLEVGDLVMMVELAMSRGSWPLARVSRVFPAADGRVRSAEIRTASGKLYTRPTTKICFLEEECK
ncbi:uncharacterized protein LOC122393608 [Amphibalanus amphitrite]|uniref:uncharacterized protein LOC122393608 n=1 Tax=Amphibalanus amphitrite TaxID=1232801 RepID=UPI001C91678C|nr:uncharacterized protein LOC122393608 [Amphibalanus amphitrite]